VVIVSFSKGFLVVIIDVKWCTVYCIQDLGPLPLTVTGPYLLSYISVCFYLLKIFLPCLV